MPFNPAYILVEDTLCVISQLYLAAFKIFSVSLAVQSVFMWISLSLSLHDVCRASWTLMFMFFTKFGEVFNY